MLSKVFTRGARTRVEMMMFSLAKIKREILRAGHTTTMIVLSKLERFVFPESILFHDSGLIS